MITSSLLALFLILGPVNPTGPTPSALRIGLGPRQLTTLQAPRSRRQEIDRLKGPVIGGFIGAIIAYAGASTFRSMSDAADKGSMVPVVGAGIFIGAVVGALIQGDSRDK